MTDERAAAVAHLRRQVHAYLKLLMGPPLAQGDVTRALANLSSRDRALLREALDTFTLWVRREGGFSDADVDAMIERLGREIGPPLFRDVAAEREAARERLRGEVRASIRRRLHRATGSTRPDRAAEDPN